jgi:hypothetical protein
MTGRAKFAAAGVLLLAAFSVALCFLYMNEGNAADGLWLVRRPTTDITGIGVTDHENDVDAGIVMRGGDWLMDGGDTVPEERIASLLAALSYLKARHEVSGDDASDLSRFGLDEPLKSLRVEYSDGESDTWQVGDYYAERGSYIKRSGHGSVYFIDNLRAEVIGASLRTLLEIPLNQVDFRRINGIRVESPGHGKIMMNRSESPRGGGDFFWRIYEPYAGNALKRKAEEIMSIAEEARWVRKVGGTEPDDGAYDRTLALYDTFDRELVIRLGPESGGRMMCKISGMDGVYEMKSVAPVFESSPEDFVDMTLYYYEPASVTEFRFAFEGREHYLVSLWEETDDADRKGQRLIIDSKGISGASYHEFTKSITSIKAEGIYRGGEESLGRRAGSMMIRRMSAPYEETIEFMEIDDMPEYVGVSYGGRVLSYARKGGIERLMDIADALAGDG